jgi:hypothetical protein
MIQLQFGLPNRSFKSFNEASRRLCRFYGGIHYRAAIENGLYKVKK